MTRTAPLSIARALLIALFALSAAAPSSAQDDPKQSDDIRGIVVDRSTGAPLAGVWVGVADSRANAVTNAEGRFVIHRVRLREFTLEAEHLGYRNWSSVVVRPEGDDPVRVELVPDPVLLKEIQVVSDRLRNRRNAIPYSVRAYDGVQLTNTGAWDAYDFLRTRLFTTRCPARSHATTCIVRRGSIVSPSVFVDDAPFFGGLDVLLGWPLQQLYTIEVINSGAQVRVYTKNFAERLAQGRTRLMPVILF